MSATFERKSVVQMPSSPDFDRASIRRLIASLVADEIGSSRGSSLQIDSLSWTDDVQWKEASGLELDSIETFNAGARVNQFFRLFETGIEDYLLVQPRMGDWVDIVLQARSLCHEALTFTTAGSMGEPKRCTHKLHSLSLDADFIARELSVKRVVSLVPPHHIYGFLYTVWMPLLADLEVVDARKMSPSALRRELRSTDLLVGTPFVLTNINRMIPEGISGAQALSSTAALSGPTHKNLVAAGFGQVTEIYGSSETLGIGWRRDPDEPFSLFPWWSWTDDIQVLESHETQCTVRLRDHVSVESPHAREFRVHGRCDDAVQVAGNNIHIGVVEQLLNDTPGVLESRVRLDRSVESAVSRLKAFVVPDGSLAEKGLLECLRRKCREELPEHARPVSWTFGYCLPVNAMGKAIDWPIAP